MARKRPVAYTFSDEMLANIKKYAEIENRTQTNFVEHSISTYIQNKFGGSDGDQPSKALTDKKASNNPGGGDSSRIFYYGPERVKRLKKTPNHQTKKTP